MNADYRRLPARFGPETRFEIRPTFAAPFRLVMQNRFEELEARLLAERLETVWEQQMRAGVRRAANEAAALAWTTSYPLLVFPVLFEEKAVAALLQAEHQQHVLRRSQDLLALANTG